MVLDLDRDRSMIFFLKQKNIFNVNYETGGILAENEVEGQLVSGDLCCSNGQPINTILRV